MGAGKGGGGPRGAEENGCGGVVLRPPRVASPCGAAAPCFKAERRLSDLGVRGRSPCACFFSSGLAQRHGAHSWRQLKRDPSHCPRERASPAVVHAKEVQMFTETRDPFEVPLGPRRGKNDRVTT
jgi:hypothetical protein